MNRRRTISEYGVTKPQRVPKLLFCVMSLKVFCLILVPCIPVSNEFRLTIGVLLMTIRVGNEDVYGNDHRYCTYWSVRLFISNIYIYIYMYNIDI